MLLFSVALLKKPTLQNGGLVFLCLRAGTPERVVMPAGSGLVYAFASMSKGNRIWVCMPWLAWLVR